jgi:alpha-galactosidase
MAGAIRPESAVFAYVQLTPSTTTLPLTFAVPGLDPDRTYRVSTIDEIRSTATFGKRDLGSIGRGLVASGAHLGQVGLQPPVLHPETALLIEIVDIERGADRSPSATTDDQEATHV